MRPGPPVRPDDLSGNDQVVGPAIGSGLRSLVAVCAHPDDESFGLGAVIDALVGQGVSTAVLSFTRGEASTLHGAGGDLGAIRAGEFSAAADVLGVADVLLLDHPDGGLRDVDLDVLVAEVVGLASAVGANGLLAFDSGGITGHPDHQRATDAAQCAGDHLDIPVLAWSVPAKVAASLNASFGTSFIGRREDKVDIVLRVDRQTQTRAIACHASQSIDNPVLWRRLDLMGEFEWLRWLREPRLPS
jgi:LmbE family N-acetylglucosaminyl deacetylase